MENSNEIGTYLEEKYRRLILFRKKKNPTNLMLLTYIMKKEKNVFKYTNEEKCALNPTFSLPVK